LGPGLANWRFDLSCYDFEIDVSDIVRYRPLKRLLKILDGLHKTMSTRSGEKKG
jgi:hypothetical protein